MHTALAPSETQRMDRAASGISVVIDILREQMGASAGGFDVVNLPLNPDVLRGAQNRVAGAFSRGITLDAAGDAAEGLLNLLRREVQFMDHLDVVLKDSHQTVKTLVTGALFSAMNIEPMPNIQSHH